MELLDRIHSPAHLRGLTADQLARLCAEIRRFLVGAVSRHGGHLGSNLGVVELTVALHRVFDSPIDALIWDTGHQAYVHKILTGRRSGFASLRQRGGLSGFPARGESAHDWVENSHASPGLSYAHGLSVAVRGTGARVVAVVGDGALTGGMAYEALNNIGYHQVPVIVVVNDNGRSYAPTISPLTLAEPGLDQPHAEAGWTGDRDPAGFFGSLGLGYLGPVDGHDIDATEDALRAAADRGGPVVVHALTVKGRGYRPAQQDAEKRLHDVGPFDPAVGPVAGPAGPPSYSELFGQALVEAAAADERVHVICAAMAGTVGLSGFARRYPDRFLDVGIAEAHGVTVAAGMAMGGLRPVFAVVSTFLARAFDQLSFDVGLHRLPVLLGVDRAGITGPDGPSHHGVLDLALLTRIPGMTVLAPSSGPELSEMVRYALRCNGPCAIRYPKGPAAPAIGALGAGERAERKRPGNDICLVAAGRLLPSALAAAELIERDAGVSVSVWDPRLISPLDEAMLADAARHRLVLTVEDGARIGGLGSLFAAQLPALRGPTPPVVPLGVPAEYVQHGDPGELLAALGLDAAGIARSARTALRRIESAGTANPISAGAVPAPAPAGLR